MLCLMLDDAAFMFTCCMEIDGTGETPLTAGKPSLLVSVIKMKTRRQPQKSQKFHQKKKNTVVNQENAV